MFSEEEMILMRECGLNMDFNNLSDDDYIKIEDVIGDMLVQQCLDENYNPNAKGLVCEEILDKLSKV